MNAMITWLEDISCFSLRRQVEAINKLTMSCLLYTSDAADDMQCVDLGGRRIIKKKIFFKQKTAYEM